MELTRRDTLTALSAAVGGGLAGCSAPSSEPETEDVRLGEQEIETLVTLAAILYPSEAENVRNFVKEYASERVRQNPDHGRGVVEAISAVNDYTTTIYDEQFAALSTEIQTELLAEMPVTTADPVPDGTDQQRVRYYLVNDLLYAFYATPTGASLAGLENPPGYPGGTTSYQRGPR
jgi:hypothetical protein